MKNQINVTLTNMNGDIITFEDVASVIKNILNFQKKYFIEGLEIKLNKSQLIDKDTVFEKFDSIKNIKISIIEDTTKEIEFSKNMYLCNDESKGYIKFYTRPHPRTRV